MFAFAAGRRRGRARARALEIFARARVWPPTLRNCRSRNPNPRAREPLVLTCAIDFDFFYPGGSFPSSFSDVSLHARVPFLPFFLRHLTREADARRAGGSLRQSNRMRCKPFK